MLGAIIFLVILVIIMPVGILMSFGALAGIIGFLTKDSVDGANVDDDGEPSELLAIAQSDPWSGPAETEPADAS